MSRYGDRGCWIDGDEGHRADSRVPGSRQSDALVPRRHSSERRHCDKRRRGSEPTRYEWGCPAAAKAQRDVKGDIPVPQDGVNMQPSGNLLKDTNMYRGFVINYTQPPEARKPHKRWRLYPFKGANALPFYQIHRESAYLLGRNRVITDIPTDHPSCSLQHAVIQYRSVDYRRENGTTGRRILPYIIDLGSTNGTHLNGNRIEPQRYYELRERDVIRFGFSSREYVLLHENSIDALEENPLNECKPVESLEEVPISQAFES